jgi:hypothetical protein
LLLRSACRRPHCLLYSTVLSGNIFTSFFFNSAGHPVDCLLSS